MEINRKEMIFVLIMLFVMISCGGSGAGIKIVTPDNQENPYDSILSQPNSSLYFRFLKLRSGFDSICDTTGDAIWYPGNAGDGISPDLATFNIGKAGLEEGQYYRVELYGKLDSSDMQSAWLGEYYGYPDCPLKFEKGSDSLVNICFGTVAADPACGGGDSTTSPICGGMRTFSSCSR